MIDHLNNQTPERLPTRKYGSHRRPDVSYPSEFGGYVKVMEAMPTDEMGEVATDKPAVVYAHGSASFGQVEPTIEAMAEYGFDALSLEFEGDRVPDSDFMVGAVDSEGAISFHETTNRDMKELLKAGIRPDVLLPKQQLQDAQSLLNVLARRRQDGLDDGPVDVVAQSASAAVGLIAAYLDSDPSNESPRLLNEVVLAYPGGIIGPQEKPTRRILSDALARRAFKPSLDNDFRPEKRVSAAKAAVRQAKTPGFRQDGAALRYGSLAPLLHIVAEREDGPKVTILAGEHDRIFNATEIEAALTDPADAEIITVATTHGIGGRRDVLETILAQLG